MIDEKGNKFGALTVIEYAKDKNDRGAWLCQCDCGNTRIVRGPDLRKNKVTTCGPGCPYKKKQSNAEVGNKYGRLLVIEQSRFRTKDGKVQWKCQCDCGNMITATTGSLHSGDTVSCGCYSRDAARERRTLNIQGQRFGKLVALENTQQTGCGGCFIWKCQCDCGNIAYIETSNLTSGNTQSCGCIHSQSELYITNLLNKKKLNFTKEYTFEDLKSDKNTKLRFDFAIFSS